MRRSKACERRGMIMVIVLGGLVALLGMTALVVDLGMVIMVKAQTQAVADASALAAASALRDGMDEAVAIQAALDIAAANEIMCEPVLLDPSVDIEVGAWDAANEQIVPWSAAFTVAAAQVTVRYTQDSPNGPVPIYFGRMLGREFTEASRSAAATVGIGDFPRKSVNLMSVQDASGSFMDEWSAAMNANNGLVDLVNTISREGDTIGFVAFNDGIKQTTDTVYWPGYEEWIHLNLAFGLAELPVGDEPLSEAMLYVRNILLNDTPQGWTNPGIAINWAVDDFLANGGDASEWVILLVSDGMPLGSNSTITAQWRQDGIDAADRAAAEGIKIHTVTLTVEEYSAYGSGGADFEFNESLVRNGGYAFRTHDPTELQAILYTVGNIEYGKAALFK